MDDDHGLSSLSVYRHADRHSIVAPPLSRNPRENKRVPLIRGSQLALSHLPAGLVFDLWRTGSLSPVILMCGVALELWFALCFQWEGFGFFCRFGHDSDIWGLTTVFSRFWRLGMFNLCCSLYFWSWSWISISTYSLRLFGLSWCVISAQPVLYIQFCCRFLNSLEEIFWWLLPVSVSGIFPQCLSYDSFFDS